MKRIIDALVENGVFGPAVTVLIFFFIIAIFHGEWLAFFSLLMGAIIAGYYLATKT